MVIVSLFDYPSICFLKDNVLTNLLLMALHSQLDQQPRASISGTSPGGHKSQAMSGQINSCIKGDAKKTKQLN